VAGGFGSDVGEEGLVRASVRRSIRAPTESRAGLHRMRVAAWDSRKGAHAGEPSHRPGCMDWLTESSGEPGQRAEGGQLLRGRDGSREALKRASEGGMAHGEGWKHRASIAIDLMAPTL
jgi:hypothetical protein